MPNSSVDLYDDAKSVMFHLPELRVIKHSGVDPFESVGSVRGLIYHYQIEGAYTRLFLYDALSESNDFTGSTVLYSSEIDHSYFVERFTFNWFVDSFIYLFDSLQARSDRTEDLSNFTFVISS